MVSESELIGRLREFLRSSDLTTTTTATVRRQLEADFGIDLSDRKAFIREQVDLFLQSVHNQPQHEQGEEEQQEQEQEEEYDVKPERSRGSGSKEETEEDGEEEEDDDNDDDDDNDNDDEEEEEEKPKHVRNGKKKNKERSDKSANEVVKKRGGGFCKLCSLSPQLQEFVGASEMARTEVVKQLWNYIREKKLQDPKNKRNIICDEPFQALFGVNSIDMFQMNKALSKHIWPLDSNDVILVKSAPKEKQKHEREDEDPEEQKSKGKRQKGGKSGFLAPLQLSEALVNFLGTGESELSRAAVIKKMWEYIKKNNLQDPSDKRRIICDEKLKELFDLDSFNGFTVTKLLAPHFIKTEQ